MSKFQEVAAGMLAIGIAALIIYAETKKQVAIANSPLPACDPVERHLRRALDELKARKAEDSFFAGNYYTNAEAHYSRYILNGDKRNAEHCLTSIEECRRRLNIFG